MRSRFRRPAAIAGAVLAGLLLASLLLLWLVVDRAPAVAERNDIDLRDVAHVLAVARANDPRRALPGLRNVATITERDVDLLLNHAAHRLLGLRVQLALEPGQALLVASGTPPGLGGLAGGGPLFGSLGGWLNVRARLRQTDGLPVLDSLRVGWLPLPTSLAEPLLRAAVDHLGNVPDLALVAEVLQQVQFGQDTLSLVYVWRGDTAYRVLSAMTPPADLERLRAYSDLMVELCTQLGPDWRVQLASLIGPMFDLAQRRSLSNDAALENRAAILTLALYTTGRSVAAVVPAAYGWPRPRRLQVLLNGRDDFPQHFMVSAMLAIEGTSPLTRAIGLHKEMVDARSGSGFSFNDLAANRAGQRFGEMALGEPARLQAALARGVTEASLMPDVADLPEFLSEAEFARRFGQVGSVDYNRLLADIEQRVGGLALYR